MQAICSPFAETMLEGLTCSDRRDLTRLFPTASEEAADLLARLLHFNPSKRITAAEALAHPYVAQFHSPAEEPSAPGVITISIDDNVKVSATCLSLSPEALLPSKCLMHLVTLMSLHDGPLWRDCSSASKSSSEHTVVQSCMFQEDHMAYATVYFLKHVLRCHMVALPYVSGYLGGLVTAFASKGSMAN